MREQIVEVARRVLCHYPKEKGRGRLLEWMVPQSASIPERVMPCQNGLRFRLRKDPMYRGLYLFGQYEWSTTRFFERLVQPGDTVLDVGANFGWFTANFARLAGPQGKVVAFEPVPSIFEMTKESIALNGLDNVVAVPMGLGQDEGSFVVYTFAGLPHGHASASDLDRDDAKEHTCRVTTLDAYVAENPLPFVDVMKIDVEGFEVEVLLGATKLLQQDDAPVVVFEVNEECLAHQGRSPAELFSVLRDLGYDAFWRIEPYGGLVEFSGADMSNANFVAAKLRAAARVSAIQATL